MIWAVPLIDRLCPHERKKLIMTAASDRQIYAKQIPLACSQMLLNSWQVPLYSLRLPGVFVQWRLRPMPEESQLEQTGMRSSKREKKRLNYDLKKKGKTTILHSVGWHWCLDAASLSQPAITDHYMQISNLAFNVWLLLYCLILIWLQLYLFVVLFFSLSL